MDILIVKYLHIMSAIILFGVGLGSVFYKWRSDSLGGVNVIALTNRNVVLADWLFTSPTVIVQPVSGFFLVYLIGYDWQTTWLIASVILFVIAGACWLPVVVLQIRMRDMALQCEASGQALPIQYWRLVRLWRWLGVPAFISMLCIVALMVVKPGLL